MEKENFLVALAGLYTTTELDQTTFFLLKKKNNQNHFKRS